MNEPNPYTAPRAYPHGSVPSAGTHGFWRDADRLVVSKHGAQLPDRCIVCNAPALGVQLHKTFYWHTPWVYLLILIHVILYAIVALVVRKTAIVYLPVCAAHRARRLRGMVLGWGGALGSLGAGLALAVLFRSAVPAVAGLILGLACAVVGIVMANLASATRIDDHQAWLKVGRAFLDSLPSGPQPQEPSVGPTGGSI